jgi:hypothetical protein
VEVETAGEEEDYAKFAYGAKVPEIEATGEKKSLTQWAGSNSQYRGLSLFGAIITQPF